MSTTAPRRIKVYRTLWALAAALTATCVYAQPKLGDPVPQFLGITADGKEIQASEFSGKVLAISFWASWCGPCRKELPMLEALQRVTGQERLQVVAVNIEDRDAFRRLARSLSEYKILLTHDRGGRSSEPFARKGVPYLVIVGRDGRIRKVHYGYGEESLQEVVTDVHTVLAEK